MTNDEYLDELNLLFTLGDIAFHHLDWTFDEDDEDEDEDG